MGPLWHELSAQALNHDENYECRYDNVFGDQLATLLRLLPEPNASANKWGR
tara:strand:- start:419 stop:571 length:153 start_codon:yes stop_codon:yes gene_type:complete